MSYMKKLTMRGLLTDSFFILNVSGSQGGLCAICLLSLISLYLHTLSDGAPCYYHSARVYTRKSQSRPYCMTCDAEKKILKITTI